MLIFNDRIDRRSASRRLRAALLTTALAALLQACGGSADDQTPARLGGEGTQRATATGMGGADVTAAAARRFSGLSLNLSGFDYWSTDFPTIDQFKRAGGWFTSCDQVPLDSPYDPGACMFNEVDDKAYRSAWDTFEQDKLDLDENGWVRSLPAIDDPQFKYHMVSAILFAGDGGAHPAGTYTVLYEGRGQIEYIGATQIVRGDHRDQMTVSNAPDSRLVIRIRSTDPADHIRNIRVIPPGGVCHADRLTVVDDAEDCVGKGAFVPMETLALTQTWYPKFLAELQGVRALRFMDWGRTNDSTLARWSDRPLQGDAFWTGRYGVPLGQMTQLANKLRTDAWINIPTRADDDYARRMARFLKQQLHPQARLILEYTNEPWNWAFKQTMDWQFDQAKRAFGDVSDDNQYEWVMNWHAMRSAQLCDMVKTEFGADAGRVQCVLNAQTGWTWPVLNYSLPCPRAQAILGKECAASFDAVAIAPYFGAYISSGVARQEYITAHWFTQPDGGLNQLFEEIRALNQADQPVTPPMALAGVSDQGQAGGALAEAREGMRVYQADVANGRFRKPILAYEGGQHLVNLARDCSGLDDDAEAQCISRRDRFATQWTALFSQANRDPRMGRAYATMMNDWIDTGGQMFTAFNFVNSFGYHGAWGLKESLFKADSESPKWQVLRPYKDSMACWWANCQQ